MAGIKTMSTSLTIKKADSETEDLVLKHVASIGEQSTEVEEVDVTTLDSPNGAKEFISGAKDPGSMDIDINNCGDGQVEKLQALFDSGEVRDWVIQYPTKATLTIKAYIAKLTFGEATTDGLMKSSISLRLSGEPVYKEATTA